MKFFDDLNIENKDTVDISLEKPKLIHDLKMMCPRIGICCITKNKASVNGQCLGYMKHFCWPFVIDAL